MAQDVSRRVSQRCLDLIKRWEGFEQHAYPDPQSGGDPWTIGYGFTVLGGRPVRKGDLILREEADHELPGHVEPYGKWVGLNVKVPLTQGQFDGFTSFVYNIGPTKTKSSTAFRRLNAGDYDGCADAMSWWVSPGTRVERGLRLRRQAEIQLFNS